MSKRILSIDYLRGISILGMIYIHTNYYNLISDILEFVVVSFIMLIGITGAIVYKPRFSKNKNIISNLLKKGLYIIFIYFIYTLFYQIFSQKENLNTNTIINILSLKLTSDMLILILIGILLIILPLFLKYINNVSSALIFSIFSFILAWILYLFTQSINFNNTISFLLFGNKNSISFPIFQWIMPMVLGYTIGLKYHSKNFKKIVLMISFFITGVSFIINKILNFPIDLRLNKYPPTIYYISYGIFFTTLLLIFFEYLEKNHIQIINNLKKRKDIFRILIIVISILLFIFGILLTPDFVKKYISQDNIINNTTIQKIYLLHYILIIFTPITIIISIFNKLFLKFIKYMTLLCSSILINFGRYSLFVYVFHWITILIFRKIYFPHFILFPSIFLIAYLATLIKPLAKLI
ncbi:DUF1624 domain-containing protein [archaeon]|jgi:hypothetical protein|nr:DUF1624 domain-containing protein [archaeon]